MQLTTKISVDSASNRNVVLDKFFQFIVLNKQDSNLCEVTIYNAIAFHDDAENSKLIVEFLDEKNSRIQGIAHEDKSNFYRESDVLNQFWGANSRYDANISDIIKTFTKDKKVDEDSLYKHISSTGTNGVFGVEENKAGIDNVIIIPLEIKNESNQLILRQENHLKDSELKSIISYGYWFKSKFNIDLNTGQNGFSFTSNIDFSQSVTFKSPDFKTYIQTSKKYDIRRSKVEVKDEEDSKAGEIIKVFSQSKIKYFEEWADLGIYNSSLFKVNHGTAGDKLISDGGVRSISVKAEMEDLEKPRRREVNLLIFSIIFSLFTSFGFDRTRQLEIGGFSTIFPDISYLSIDAMWLLVCIGVFIKFTFIKHANITNLVKLALVTPIGLWFTTYLTLYQSAWLQTLLCSPEPPPIKQIYHILYSVNIAVIVYMAISIVLIRWKRPKTSPDAKQHQSKILKTFGV